MISNRHDYPNNPRPRRVRLSAVQATLFLVLSNFLVTFGAFAVLAKLDPDTAKDLFAGIAGANRFLPYLVGSVFAVAVLLLGLRLPRLIGLFSLAGVVGCLGTIGLWSQGVTGWPLLAAFAVVFAALTLTWALRADIASRYQTPEIKSRLVVWVEASFAVAAMISFLIWPKSMLGFGDLGTALWTAAVLFAIGTAVDLFVYRLSPTPKKQDEAEEEAAAEGAGPPSYLTFVRWALALALLTVGVQMTITKASDNNVLLYLSFEVGTAIAGLLASFVIIHICRAPLALNVYGEKTPKFRVDLVLSAVLCLALMVASFLLPSDPLAIRWVCLFAASLIYELAFATTLDWMGSAAAMKRVPGVVSSTKGISVVLVVGAYWVLGILSDAGRIAAIDTVLMYVAAAALVGALLCLLPDLFRKTIVTALQPALLPEPVQEEVLSRT
jgi:hypothetical protein